MATSFRPAFDGPRGREKTGEVTGKHFNGAKHTGFKGSTPAIQKAVAQFNADRKAGKDTTADRAAVTKAQSEHASKVGIGQRAENRLSHLESMQKKGVDLNTKQQAVEDRLKTISASAKTAPKTPASPTPSSWKSSVPEQQAKDNMIAWMGKKPPKQVTGAGS